MWSYKESRFWVGDLSYAADAVKNNVDHEASALVDIFRKFVMLCQFYPSYNRKLVGIQDVLGTEEVRLDNSKNHLSQTLRRLI